MTKLPCGLGAIWLGAWSVELGEGTSLIELTRSISKWVSKINIHFFLVEDMA
jgi:hypothetical protein